jgi:hypothetical protein
MSVRYHDLFALGAIIASVSARRSSPATFAPESATAPVS